MSSPKAQPGTAENAASDLPENILTFIPSVRQHVKMWILGVVVASLVPFLFLIFHGIDGDHLPGIYELLSRGDLLVISLVVTVGGMADLALVFSRVDPSQVATAAYFLIGSVLVVIGEAAWYADITATLLAGKTVHDLRSVCLGSLALFAFSIFCGGKCVSFSAGVR